MFFLMYVSTVCILVCVCMRVCVVFSHICVYICGMCWCQRTLGTVLYQSLPYSLRQGPSLNSELHYRQSHDSSYLKSLQFWDYRVYGTYLLLRSVFKCKQSYPLNNFLRTFIDTFSFPVWLPLVQTHTSLAYCITNYYFLGKWVIVQNIFYSDLYKNKTNNVNE